jgi:hypothetical protein
MRIGRTKSLILALALMPSAAFAGYSPLPYLSEFKTTGPLRCDVQGYSSYSYSTTGTNMVVICLVDRDLIFTEYGARYTTINAFETESDRFLFSYGREIDCRSLRERRTEGWKLYSNKPHSNWFIKHKYYGHTPRHIGNWWYLAFTPSREYYSDWEALEPPLDPLKKQICRAWKDKRGNVFD